MFTGRIGRLKFLLFNVVVWLVGGLAYAFAFAIGLGKAGDTAAVAPAAGLVFLTGLVVAFLISLSAWIRRFHDMDQTGWLVLLIFIPLVNLALFFILLLAPGTPGPNAMNGKETAA